LSQPGAVATILAATVRNLAGAAVGVGMLILAAMAAAERFRVGEPVVPGICVSKAQLATLARYAIPTGSASMGVSSAESTMTMAFRTNRTSVEHALNPTPPGGQSSWEHRVPKMAVLCATATGSV